MSSYLQSLDQWALSILMGIVSLFGVKDLPEQSDPYWIVEKRWEKQHDGYYLLIISSNQIQKECRSAEAKYIIFPQTYMAKQEVFADEVKVYTNEMDKEWHLKSFLDRPVVSCDLLVNSERVSFKILSYEKYFSSIGEWPSVVKDFPRGQFFYNFSYVVVGILALFCSIVFFIIGMLFKEKSYHLLIMGAGLFLVMYSHYPAYATAVHVHLAHQMSLVGVLIVAYVILNERKIDRLFSISNILFIIFVSTEFLFSYSYPHTAQLLIILNACVVLFLIFLNIFYESVLNKKIMFMLIFIFGLRDLYSAQIEREGFLNLSLLCLIITCFMSFRVVSKIYRKNLKSVTDQKKFESDRYLIEKMKEINIKSRQVIHDMKSPLTSLNFMIASQNTSIENMRIPIERMNILMNQNYQEDIATLLSWYSIKILHLSIDTIVKEKIFLAKNISYKFDLNQSINVFFDPELMKLLIAELVDNSVKNNSSDVLISINLYSAESSVFLEYRDDGVGVSKETSLNLGTLGYSTTGGGLGLYTVIERIKLIGADIDIQTETNAGFRVLIKFKSNV